MLYSFKQSSPFIKYLLVIVVVSFCIQPLLALSDPGEECTSSACYERLTANIVQLKGVQDDVLAEIDPENMGEAVQYSKHFDTMRLTLTEIMDLMDSLNIDGDTIKDLDERVDELELLVRSLAAINEELLIKIDDADRDANMTTIIFEHFDELDGLFSTFKADTEALQHANVEMARDAQSKFKRAADEMEENRKRMENIINLCNQLEAIEFDWDNHENNANKLNEHRDNIENGELDALWNAVQDGRQQVEKTKERYKIILAMGKAKDDNATELVEALQEIIGMLRNHSNAGEWDLWINKTEKMKADVADNLRSLQSAIDGSRDQGKLVKSELESMLNVRFEETSDELEKLIKKIEDLLATLNPVDVENTPSEIEEKIQKLTEEANDIDDKTQEMIGEYNFIREDLNDADNMIDEVEESALHIGAAVDETNVDLLQLSADVNATQGNVDAFCNRTNDLASELMRYERFKSEKDLLGHELKEASGDLLEHGDGIKFLYNEYEKVRNATEEKLDLKLFKSRNADDLQKRYKKLLSSVDDFKRRTEKMHNDIVVAEEGLKADFDQLNLLENNYEVLLERVKGYHKQIQERSINYQNCRTTLQVDE